MTKKSILILPILLIVACFTGCNSGGGADKSVKDILERVQSEVETIESIEMATEETDNNNLLGKQGQYIELGWFVDSRVEKEPQFDDEYNEIGSVSQTGNAGGGAIEKFRSVNDAKKRNEYMASLDSLPKIMSPGFHEQYGVFVIRVSAHLTASQQNEIAEKIKKAMK